MRPVDEIVESLEVDCGKSRYPQNGGLPGSSVLNARPHEFLNADKTLDVLIGFPRHYDDYDFI